MVLHVISLYCMVLLDIVFFAQYRTVMYRCYSAPANYRVVHLVILRCICTGSVKGGECHNRIRDHIFSVAVAAALGPVREGRFLIPGTDRRPADVFIPSWADGLDAALDVTVVTPQQDATVAQAAVNAGHDLQFAFNVATGR